jgi:hypothetical protein
LCCFNKIVDHGGHRGDKAQALARWWHPVASSEAPDVASYRCIAMAIEIVVDLPAFFVSLISLFATTIS